jgi:ATP-binding cassette, subfamily G (WHITE), eye pigment precursor transporter
LKGISGGERKRTSIGVELITNPNLIFLDEPTTGLDSFTATNVIEVLSELAASGRTVISTIHQPNSEIFEMFDQLMLMSNGKILYHNSADLSVKYFKLVGFECPSLTNPADFFMNMMSIEAYDDPEDEKEEDIIKTRSKIEETYNQKIEFLAQKYQESELKCDPDNQHPEAQSLDETQEYRTNFFIQLWLLFWRSIINILRIPLSSYVKGITYAMLGVLTILVFGQMEHDCASIQNRNGVLFFVTLNLIMSSVQNVILMFPDERVVFLREQASAMYSPTAYFIAKVLSEIPGFLLFPSIFVVIVYFGTELNLTDASHYFIFHGTAILLVMATSGFGLVMGAAIADKQVAVALTPV